MHSAEELHRWLERVNNVTGVPLSLLDSDGALLESWPSMGRDIVRTEAGAAMIADFRLQGRGPGRPLISFIEPGFLIGVMELEDDGAASDDAAADKMSERAASPRYLLAGMVSPYVHARADILKMVSEVIHPARLQLYCDALMRQPLVSLEQLKDLICLLSKLLEEEISPEEIFFVDSVSGRWLGEAQLDETLFQQREEAEFHVPVDFETAICAAVEEGDRAQLERTLFAGHPGRIGRMSQNDLRQTKYVFISLATLVSRAAIRGGLPAETSFSLSDLYCQRADLLTDIPLIENLVFTMLMDYCAKVRACRKQPVASPLVQKALNYISVHLHESVGLEELSRHCGLCGRSLSLRFREEVGMGIPEYIHREKLREAEYLLRHTDYSLSEITSYLNYPSQSYFTQIFKKYLHQTPQQFRNGSPAVS